MSYSSFDLFHTGLSLGGTTPTHPPFFSLVFIMRKTCPFPSHIYILHTLGKSPTNFCYQKTQQNPPKKPNTIKKKPHK